MHPADPYIAPDGLLEDFEELLAIPSISTDPAHAGDVRIAAEWVAARCSRAGMEAALVETPGHPLVVARHHVAPHAPTLLVYAHYDVQPPDPVGAWTSPPFQPVVRAGRMYARGTADDKAQVVLQIAAAEAALAAGDLPVNLLLLFEGEEEVGSPSLEAELRANGDAYHCNHVLIADSQMFAPDRPSLIFGMRGIAYLEVEVRTADHDLHSGQYGGAVPNPAHVLARLLAGLHDAEGRVAVPGFYDDVRPIPGEVLAGWRTLGFDEDAYRASAGGAPLWGEPGFSTVERLWVRPCLDVNGIDAGYTGPGKKTVLPGSARAKLSARLVPDQDPGEVAGRIEHHLRSLAPPCVHLDVRNLQGNPPWQADPHGPLYEAAERALAGVFPHPPVRVAHGGSLPIARTFADILTPSVAVMGMALPGANMHAPDEWIPPDQLQRGARTMVRLYDELAHTS